MESNFNIEDLFKRTLENAEATPPAGAWEAIQAKMGLSAASSAGTAGTTATGLGIGKIAAIVVTALGVGLGAGYLVFKDKNTGQKSTPGQENTLPADNADAITPQLPEDVQITDVSSVNKADKVVSVVKVKKGDHTKNVLVEIHQSAAKNSNASVVDQWLSPKKDKINRNEFLQRIMEQIEKTDDEQPTDVRPVIKDNIVVKDIPEKEVVAGMKIAPLENLSYAFSNVMEAYGYEWTFGDGSSSTEANPVHTFGSPGNYVISLKVYNKDGKAFKDQYYLEVSPRQEENVPGEASSLKVPNIFTPNGDGNNDEFYFTGKNIESFNVQVVDRNGKLVFMSNSIEERWNGNDRSGSQCSEGWYRFVYTAVGKDGKRYKDKGDIKLSR